MVSSPPKAKRPKTGEQTSLTNFFQSSNEAKKNETKQSATTASSFNHGTANNNAANDSPTTNEVEKNEVKQSATAAASLNHVMANNNAANDNNNNNAEQQENNAIIPTPVRSSSNASWNTYRGACIYRKVANEPPREKVAAFDLDGTLLEWRTSGWPSRMEHYELWNASVISKLQGLHDEGYKLCIFSNQGAIRGALDGKKASHVKGLLDWVCHTIDRPVFVVMSTNKKDGNNFHKPSANMWTVAEKMCNRGEEFDVANSFYVGDSVGTEDDKQGGVDIQFAANVGKMKGSTLKFFTPNDYFGPSHKELREKAQKLGDYEEPSQETLQARAALASGYLQGPILLILCGVQGSGKSTFCNKLLEGNADRWLHLAQDIINGGKPGKREKVEEEARKALQNNKSVVIDRMHLDGSQRAYFVNLAKSVGVPAHAVALTPDKDLVLKRVRERENHPGGVQGEKGVTIAARSKLEMPKYSEGLILISASATVDGAEKIANLYRGVSFTQGAITLPTSFPLGDKVALPSIALGTAKLGRKAATDVVSNALKMGFEAVDTAPTYKNEDKVGEAINDDTFCIVKVPKRATTPEQVLKELEDSLSNLKRKHADLILLHWPSDVIAAGTLKKVWKEMEKLKNEGRARAIGVCNFNVQALRVLLPHCTIPPAVNQVERHPLLPCFELLDFCAQHDILLQAHSPLGQGSSDLLDHAIVKEIAKSTDQSAAQVVLKWNLQQGVAVAAKCSSEEHMREILAVRSSNSLSVEHMKALNELETKKRFVDPPFMYGQAPYCWGKVRPGK